MLPRMESQQDAIGTLYADHHGWLKTWLRCRMGNETDAADLAHDTFVRLLSKNEPVCMREPRAFLSTVARGLLANLSRRRRIEQAYLDSLAHLPEALTPGPERRAQVLEALIEIDRRLGKLSARTRRAFLLFQLDGMPQQDIARELQVSLATVQRDIVRAMHACFFPE